MKLTTALAFVTICAAAGVSEVAHAGRVSDDSATGTTGKKERKLRSNEVLARRTSPLAQFEANANTGRGARHSCIADFQALCLDDEGKLLSRTTIEEAAKKAADAAASGNGKGGKSDTVAETPAEDEKKADDAKAEARGFSAQALAGSSTGDSAKTAAAVVRSNRKQRLALRGMERCLTIRMDEISDDKCKAFIVGRNQCFTEAEAICSAKADAEDKKEEAVVNAPARVADTVVDEKAVKKDKELSRSVANLALSQKLTNAQLAEIRADYARVQCIRKTDTAQFSAACANSTYYASLRILKGKRTGLRAKLAEKLKIGGNRGDAAEKNSA